MTTTCLLADIPVAFVHRHPYLSRAFADYRTELAPVLTVAVSDADLASEAVRDPALPPPALEVRALYRAFIRVLPSYGAFFLHAALLSVDGRGVAICAPSGVGKSTHAALWRELLGERLRVINGDKPLFRRREDGRFFGYGAPLSGKEGWQENTAVPIEALVFLSRAERDSITPLTAEAAFPLLYPALQPPSSEGEVAALLPLAAALLSSARLYSAAVTKERSAALVTFHTVFPKE